MSKINELTKEQHESMIKFREEWRQIGLATGPADVDAIRPVINDFYSCIGKTSPYIWRCDSPLMANIIICILRDNLEDNLRANLGDNLWDNLRDNLGVNLWDNLWDNLRDKKIEYTQTYLWGALNAYWIAYYIFPHIVLRPMHTDDQMAVLNEWATIAKNSFWLYPFDGICFVCDRPNEYHFDEQWRLHNPSGPVVRFSDGYSLYAVHGVMLPDWVIEHPEQITVDKIRDEQNAEVRRVMIDQYGQARYLSDSGAEHVHSDGYGDLYRANIPDDEPLVMVKVVNSTPEPDGTYRDYFIRVPPDVETAEQAVAWIGGFEVGQFEYVQQS